MRFADATRIEELAEWSKGWCVSAYLPSHRISDDASADLLRLRNLLRSAENELVQLGLRSTDAAEVVADAVPQELADPTSEVFHKAGVAVFAAPGLRRSYRHTHGASEFCAVSPRFQVRPLLAELAHDHRFFVLALTRGSAQLLHGNREQLTPVPVSEMPDSLEDAIRYDDRERVLLSHSASRRGVGSVVAAFHGQGDRADHLPEDLARFLRMVDAAVCRLVPDALPVVPAGSLDLVALYRDLTSLRALTEEEITGNPETMAPDELHERAWKIVDAEATERPDDALADFHRLQTSGRASAELPVVVEGSRYGRIAALIVASDAASWGRVDDESGEISLHESRLPGDEDLLDRAAVDAWKAGAKVHIVPQDEMPEGLHIAAVFRY